MIDFVIMPIAGEVTNWIETVHVAVSFDLQSCHYTPGITQTSPAEIERLSEKAFRMKCPETNDAFSISVMAISEKVREAPEAIQKHIRAYLNHPLRFIVARDIERMNIFTDVGGSGAASSLPHQQ